MERVESSQTNASIRRQYCFEWIGLVIVISSSQRKPQITPCSFLKIYSKTKNEIQIYQNITQRTKKVSIIKTQTEKHQTMILVQRKNNGGRAY